MEQYGAITEEIYQELLAAVGPGGVIMNDSVVGEGAELKYVILDKDVTVTPGAKLIGTKKSPVIVKRRETV